MSYKIGLVGLPNAGKSSLFNFLTKKNVLAENYPFATIEPNVGMMILEDDRLEKIKKILNSKKIVNESIKIIDIAGLVKGASEGKGLGNEFLSHIRGVDLVCHVLRCFKDKNIIHVENEINPIKDYETIAMEIILSDLQQVEKILKKLKVRNDEDKEEKFILEKAKSVLEEGMMIKNCIFSEEEKKILKKYSLITSKSSILLLNYGESDETSETQEIKKYSEKNSLENFSINVRVEKELDNLTKEEKIDFGWEGENNLNKFAEKIKKELGLKIFFSAGKEEVKSWMAQKNLEAKKCGGIIHSDIEDNFIQLEVYNYDDLKIINENPKLIKTRREGSCYIIKEGDICNFLFGKKKK